MMWLGETYWNPARPPSDAVSIEILQQRPNVTIDQHFIKKLSTDFKPDFSWVNFYKYNFRASGTTSSLCD